MYALGWYRSMGQMYTLGWYRSMGQMYTLDWYSRMIQMYILGWYSRMGLMYTIGWYSKMGQMYTKKINVIMYEWVLQNNNNLIRFTHICMYIDFSYAQIPCCY